MNARHAALAALVLSTGCQSFSAPDSVVYGAAVVTQYAPGTSWSSYATFDVDSIVSVLDGTGSVERACAINAVPLAQAIEDQMTARGYAKAAVPGTGDLQIKMSAYLGSVSYYYAGWCGWYPYYYCYPGWSYAGSYSYGTLVLDMADAMNASPGGRIDLVWTDANYGVLASYYNGCSTPLGTVNWSKIVGAIDRAFEQSPYLVK